MYRITVDIMDPQGLGPLTAKETVTMALEPFGLVRVVSVVDPETAPGRAGQGGNGGALGDPRQIRLT